MVEITDTEHQIEITTIEIDSTILAITIGDIITQMVSPRLGAIVRIVTQINIKTGLQDRYQGGNHRNSPNNYNNEDYGWNQGVSTW